jgi:hypothetical protein
VGSRLLPPSPVLGRKIPVAASRSPPVVPKPAAAFPRPLRPNKKLVISVEFPITCRSVPVLWVVTVLLRSANRPVPTVSITATQVKTSSSRLDVTALLKLGAAVVVTTATLELLVVTVAAGAVSVGVVPVGAVPVGDVPVEAVPVEAVAAAPALVEPLGASAGSVLGTGVCSVVTLAST